MAEPPKLPAKLKDLDEHIRGSALREAERNTRGFAIVRKLLFPVEVAASVAASVTGAILSQLVFGTLKNPQLWTAVGVALGLVTIGLLSWTWYLQRRVNDGASLAPTEVQLRLQDASEEAQQYRALAQSLQAWTLLQHDTSRELFEHLNQINRQLAALGAGDGEQMKDLLKDADTRFKEILERVVSQLEMKRSDLLGYETTHETYFFDIFELKADGRLHVLARRTNSQDTYFRSWGMDDGHLGYCLRSNGDHYVNYQQSVDPFSGPHEKPTDRRNFGCRITCLVRAADERVPPVHGAICITSSKHDRLNQAQVALVANLAQPLSGLFYTRELLQRRINAFDAAKRAAQAPQG